MSWQTLLELQVNLKPTDVRLPVAILFSYWCRLSGVRDREEKVSVEPKEQVVSPQGSCL